MSESKNPVSYASGLTARKTYLAQIGGAMGIAGCIIGLAIFMAGCCGFGAAFNLSIIPLALGVPGLILTIIGGFTQTVPASDDNAPIAGMFVNVAAIIGGLLEVAAWRGWTVMTH